MRWVSLGVIILISIGFCGGGVLGAVDAGPSESMLITSVDYDQRLDSSETYWAGQRLWFNGSEIVSNVSSAPRDERTFQIRRVTTSHEVAGLVAEFVLGTDGREVIETDNQDGLYVIRYHGKTVYVQDGVGYIEAPPDGTAVTIRNSEWEVAVQRLEASWSKDRITRRETADLQLRSNRATYQVEISAKGLSFRDLEALFDSDDFADDYDAKRRDDVIVLDAGAEVDLPVDFSQIDDDSYMFTIEVTDSTATTTATAQVGRQTQPTEATPTQTPTPDSEATPTITPTKTATVIPDESPTETPTPTGTPPLTTTTQEATPTKTVQSPSPTQSPTVARTVPPTTTQSPGQSGFGILVAVAALLIGVFVIRRPG